MNSNSGIFKIAIFTAFSFLLFSCNSKNDKAEKVINSAVNTDSALTKSITPIVITNRYFNDFSRYIAGLEPLDGSMISTDYHNEVWKKFANQQNSKWIKLKENHFKEIESFTNSELHAVNAATSTIFYPFSGPDFLHVVSFFPKATTYYMLALEPPGSLPALSQLEHDSLNDYLNTINQSLYAILNFSFFRTLSMEKDFKNQELNGAVQLISIFIQRSGFSIATIEKAYLNADGKISNDSVQACAVPAIHIQIIENATQQTKDIYYLSGDISNLGLNKSTCLKQFINQLPEFTTYLKSASYLLHKPYFSEVRDAILQKSKFVLQDDSGVPVFLFNEKDWNHKYYGSYDKPIDLFRNFFQKSLFLAYDSIEKATIKPLNFGIGYDHKTNESNLMLFSKK